MTSLATLWVAHHLRRWRWQCYRHARIVRSCRIKLTISTVWILDSSPLRCQCVQLQDPLNLRDTQTALEINNGCCVDFVSISKTCLANVSPRTCRRSVALDEWSIKTGVRLSSRCKRSHHHFVVSSATSVASFATVLLCTPRISVQIFTACVSEVQSVFP